MQISMFTREGATAAAPACARLAIRRNGKASRRMMTAMLATAIFSVLLSAAPSSAGTMGPFSSSPPPVQMGPLVRTVHNWAGYVAETDFAKPQGVVTAVSGSWIVPTATPAANANGSRENGETRSRPMAA